MITAGQDMLTGPRGVPNRRANWLARKLLVLPTPFIPTTRSQDLRMNLRSIFVLSTLACSALQAAACGSTEINSGDTDGGGGHAAAGTGGGVSGMSGSG